MKVELRAQKNQTIVVLNTTVGGCYDSVPSIETVKEFVSLSSSEREDYLEDYYSHGHGEGAENLCILAASIDCGYDYDDIVVVVQEV
jgi:hypothetical protein